MTPKQLWESVLVELGLSVSKANFQTWFKDTAISRTEDGVAYLAVPNAFVRDWLSDKYHKTIVHALRGLSEHIRSVEYVISKDEQRKIPTTAAWAQSNTANTELPLKEHYINKESNLNPRYTFESFVVGPFNVPASPNESPSHRRCLTAQAAHTVVLPHRQPPGLR